MGFCRPRPPMIVRIYDCSATPRHRYPMTVGVDLTAHPRRRTTLSKVSLLSRSISRLARHAAGRPPSASPR